MVTCGVHSIVQVLFLIILDNQKAKFLGWIIIKNSLIHFFQQVLGAQIPEPDGLRSPSTFLPH